MNVLVAADMEGVAGIEHYGDCLPSHPRRYARGRRLLTDEVLVAVEALRAGGAGTISVGDWHMVGTNIERERMPAGVEVRPIADLALNEAEPSIAKAHGGPLDAVVMVGHHARTPSPKGFCSHTFIWGMEVLLDGAQLSETQTYAQALGAEGIPILVASGDRWVLEETEEGELGSALKVVDEGGRRTGATPARRTPSRSTPSCARRSPPRWPAPGSHRRHAATRPSWSIRVEGEEIARTTIAEPAELLTAIATVFRAPQIQGVPAAGQAAAAGQLPFALPAAPRRQPPCHAGYALQGAQPGSRLPGSAGH